MASSRRKAQRVSLAFAYLFYVLALACVGAVAWFTHLYGGNHPAVAAFSASVVFFIGGGIVLQVMGKADLPDLKIRSRD